MTQEARCSVCGAALRSERITYAQPTGDTLALVVEAPADVCPQCGEQYLSADTVDAIQHIVEERCEPELISVPRYRFFYATGQR